MEIKDKIKELKSQAYDLLAVTEQYKVKLVQVNQQILELTKKLMEEEASKAKEESKPAKK